MITIPFEEKCGQEMVIQKRLEQFREKMAEHEIDMYFVPTNDYHGSEYVSDYFKVREFLSGFDGSAGNMLITQKETGLWTDGRYFLQAEAQLSQTGITLYKSGKEGVPKINDKILEEIPEGGTLGADGRMVSAAWAEGMKKMLAGKNAKLELSYDPAGEIWTKRPELCHARAWILEEEFTGESRLSKLGRLRGYLSEKKGSMIVLTSLDEIAWLLNIRGNDIPCNPVVFSYLVVQEKECHFFVGEHVFSSHDKKELEGDGLIFHAYGAIYSYLQKISGKEHILLDKRTVNAHIVESIPEGSVIEDVVCPVILWKAVKNPVEIKNEREAHIRDGVAVTRFICWLKQNIDKIPLTERSAAEILEKFRQEERNYLGASFEPIAGYAEHGAIVHYSATEESDSYLAPENFLLLDTGGQYMEGTTDITRTILLGGKATAEQKKYYTAVLRGNLNLCAAQFLHGCSGVSLDYAARQPLWEMGCDYNHGTGHGVGYLLNVHEAPNAFRYKILEEPGQNVVLEEGMITSDEPGFYLEGEYGIRLENLILCVKREKNEYGQFMGFEPLTLVPFERDAIDVEQMSGRERERLNMYHQMVFETIGPFLSKEEREWLADACAPL